MSFVRAIAVFFLAGAVALAPLASASAAAMHPASPAHEHIDSASHHHDHAAAHGKASHEHAATAHPHALAATDCCPSEASVPLKAAHDCGDMSGCALCHLNLSPNPGSLSVPFETATALSWQMSQALPPVASSPPFRPPRS